MLMGGKRGGSRASDGTMGSSRDRRHSKMPVVMRGGGSAETNRWMGISSPANFLRVSGLVLGLYFCTDLEQRNWAILKCGGKSNIMGSCYHCH